MRIFLLTIFVTFSAFASEFVVKPGTFPNNHASTLAELSDGTLLACWFAGSKEAAKDVQIYCSRKKDEAPWTAPEVAVRQGEGPKFVGNPSLLLDDEGVLWLFYEAVTWGGHSGAYIDYKTSHDGGKSWSRRQRLAGGFFSWGHLPRNKGLRISQNRFLLPVYREFTSHYGYVIDLELTGGKIKKKKTYRIPGNDHLQPSLVQLSPTKVAAYLRTKKAKQVLVSYLDLPTMKFSGPFETNLPNPDAAVDAISDGEGRVLIAYNDSQTKRTPLSLALSENGMAFIKVRDLRREDGSFAYPTLLKTKDGKIHLTYSYNRDSISHEVFSLEDLKLP